MKDGTQDEKCEAQLMDEVQFAARNVSKQDQGHVFHYHNREGNFTEQRIGHMVQGMELLFRDCYVLYYWWEDSFSYHMEELCPLGPPGCNMKKRMCKNTVPFPITSGRWGAGGRNYSTLPKMCNFSRARL